MPQDACELLLFKEYKDEHEKEDLEQECIGEKAQQNKAWIPLCVDYPNLKGIACKPLHDYIDTNVSTMKKCIDFYPRYTYYIKNDIYPLTFEEIIAKGTSEPLAKILEKIIQYEPDFKEILTLTPEQMESKNKFDKDDPVIDPDFKKFLTLTSNIEIKPNKVKSLKIYLASIYDPKFIELIHSKPEKSCPILYSRTSDPTNWYIDQDLNQDAQFMLDNRYGDLTYRDVFSHVKMFDRDEIYNLSKKLMTELNDDTDLELELYKKWKVENNFYTDREKLITQYMNKDPAWKQYKETQNYLWDRSKLAKEKKMIDYAYDPNTIFITTPRGGHEFLSIFAYANGMKKDKFPSDIEKERKHDPSRSEMYGNTWLGNKTEDKIERVVILDDIIESGDQLKKTYEQLIDKFGKNIIIKSIAICGRREPENTYHFIYNPQTGKISHEDDFEKDNSEMGDWIDPFQEAIYGYEIHDIDEWRRMIDQNEKDAIATCIFPWHISDSRTSKYIKDIFQDRDVGTRK